MTVIRKILIDGISRGINKNRLLISEMKLDVSDNYGESKRIDIAIINPVLSTGIEIKSDHDTLKRLPGQIEVYDKIFDRLFLATTARHLKKAKSLVPDYWGMLIFSKDNFNVHRQCSINAKIDPYYLSRLFLKKDIINILKPFRIEHLSRLSKKGMSQLIPAHVGVAEIKRLLAASLMKRKSGAKNE
jgi:hypothetical protein